MRLIWPAGTNFAWRARPISFMAGYWFLATWPSSLCYWGRWIIFWVKSKEMRQRGNTILWTTLHPGKWPFKNGWIRGLPYFYLKIVTNIRHWAIPEATWSSARPRSVALGTRVAQTSPSGWNRFQPQIDPVQNRGTFLWTVISKICPWIIRSKISFLESVTLQLHAGMLGSEVAQSLKSYGNFSDLGVEIALSHRLVEFFG